MIFLHFLTFLMVFNGLHTIKKGWTIYFDRSTLNFPTSLEGSTDFNAVLETVQKKYTKLVYLALVSYAGFAHADFVRA